MRKLQLLGISLCLTVAAGGCVDVVDINFERVPSSAVYVPFTTEAEWHLYGVAAPLDNKTFIKAQGLPKDYHYIDYAFTGMAGVLLTCDLHGGYHVFDRRCPVELDPAVCIQVDLNANVAKCPRCGSTYDIFCTHSTYQMAGIPLSGPAQEQHFGLRRYKCVFNADNRYALLTN